MTKDSSEQQETVTPRGQPSVVPSNVEYESRITRLTFTPRGGPIFSEQATHIEIDDEAAGEFVKLSQEDGNTDIKKWIAIEPSEWPVLRDAIQFMIDGCR